MSRRRVSTLLLAAAVCGACRPGPSDREAQAAVRRYVAATADAFRTGDAQPVARVAAFPEFRKVAALVGAKMDAGMTMDAVLLDLAVERVERADGRASVVTRERWSWRDLQVGSGAQVGPESLDRYHVRYHLSRDDGRWVVSRVEFVDPPEVGRKDRPRIPASGFH